MHQTGSRGQCSVLLRCAQGLDWYKAKLKQDKDGDVADEFLLEKSDKSTKGPDKGLQVKRRGYSSS